MDFSLPPDHDDDGGGGGDGAIMIQSCHTLPLPSIKIRLQTEAQFTVITRVHGTSEISLDAKFYKISRVLLQWKLMEC